jgi:hypothetical protein
MAPITSARGRARRMRGGSCRPSLSIRTTRRPYRADRRHQTLRFNRFQPNVRLGSKGEVPDLLDQVRSDHDSGK